MEKSSKYIVNGVEKTNKLEIEATAKLLNDFFDEIDDMSDEDKKKCLEIVKQKNLDSINRLKKII